MNLLLVLFGLLILLIGMAGFRTVRPTQRGLVERFGKYNRLVSAGLTWVIPMIDKLRLVNTTEKMIQSEQQEIITKDKLNAFVDAVVYYKIKNSEEDVKNSQYNVDLVEDQIVSLSRTTLRNIIGTLSLSEANSERDRINDELRTHLSKETKLWGIEIVRTELKEIQPPQDVQEAMNRVVKAENEKIAAMDLAVARETQADGEKRAQIKKAEGIAKSIEIEANAKAMAIKAVNDATEKSFTKKAQLLRSLEAVEKALSSNTKIVIPAGEKLINVVGDLVGGL